jgi:hypothetical protein
VKSRAFWEANVAALSSPQAVYHLSTVRTARSFGNELQNCIWAKYNSCEVSDTSSPVCTTRTVPESRSRTKSKLRKIGLVLHHINWHSTVVAVVCLTLEIYSSLTLLSTSIPRLRINLLSRSRYRATLANHSRPSRSSVEVLSTVRKGLFLVELLRSHGRHIIPMLD